MTLWHWRFWTPALRTGAFGLFAIGYLGQSAEGWTGTLPVWRGPDTPMSARATRVGLLETDVWVESTESGALRPWSEIPLRKHRSGLLDPKAFTPSDYLAKMAVFLKYHRGHGDILLYYGGRRHGTQRPGLNFNAWSVDELHRLQTLGARPFIGLESMDPALVMEMAETLRLAGFDDGQRVPVRIGAEPSTSAYGTIEGTAKGHRHTRAAFAAYQKRFLATAKLLRQLERRRGVKFQIVFAGDTAEDFDHYMPDPSHMDAIGFDLYVTPANIQRTLKLLRRVMKKYSEQPFVFPELGIATAGETHEAGYEGVHATPSWARTALGQVLLILGKHPARVDQITVFSVDVAGRMPARRWSWAWTPVMFSMLDEWRRAPARWTPRGFHRYDLRTYPLNRTILYSQTDDCRLCYQKLTEKKGAAPALFAQIAYFRENSEWTRVQRTVRLNDQNLVDPL
jgi:hypothetical protein